MIGYFKVRIPGPEDLRFIICSLLVGSRCKKYFRNIRVFSCHLVLFVIHKKAEPTKHSKL